MMLIPSKYNDQTSSTVIKWLVESQSILKMKHLTSLFLLLLFTVGNSQTQRVFYELTYKPNTEDTIKTKELQVLVFNKDNSTFQKYKTLRSDSLFAKTNILESDLSVYEQPFIIMHNPTKKDITFKTILIDPYKYTEQIDFKWKLENETCTILNSLCQKATADYGGRKWTAWFSKDYPFSLGPYKFFGLPGLILKIYDANDDYEWEAKAVLRQNNANLYEKNYFELQGMKSISVKKEDFKKIEKEYKSFPLGNVMMHFPDADGVEIKEMKMKEKELAEKYKYYNNEIGK